MDEKWKKARRAVGLPKFERECPLTPENGGLKKSWRVPGTREHGTHHMLCHAARDLIKRGEI